MFCNEGNLVAIFLASPRELSLIYAAGRHRYIIYQQAMQLSGLLVIYVPTCIDARIYHASKRPSCLKKLLQENF